MVHLYIKQRIEVAGKYKVYNENQEEIFWLQAKPYSLGAEIKMVDAATDKMIYEIKEKVKWSLNRNFEIFSAENNQFVCSVRTLSSLKFKVEIETNGSENSGETSKYQIKGDFLSFKFKILNDKLQIGSIEKKLVWFGNAYVLDILDSFDSSLFTAIVIIIDTLISVNKNSGFGPGF